MERLLLDTCSRCSQVYRGVLIEGNNTIEVAIKTHKTGDADRAKRLEFLKEARSTGARLSDTCRCQLDCVTE